MPSHLNYLIILFLAFSILQVSETLGQGKVSTLPRPNYIDSIKTTEEVLLLIGKLNNTYKNFTPQSKITELSDWCKNNLKANRLKDWTKVDFDHNGLTDIIIVGKYYSVNAICILDMGKSYQFEPISFGHYNCIGIDVIKDKIRCRIFDTNKNTTTTPVPIVTKYLVYRYGGFIDENANPAQHRIEKITYSTTRCFGKCTIFEININNNRHASLNAIKDNTIEGQTMSGNYHAVITESKYKALTDLLNYMNFEKLDNSYSPKLKDAQKAILTITYDNGKIKTITDNGLKGTQSLTYLHRLLFDLRKNQDWKK